ncbi:hypothetical protein [Alteromonas flava]|uniref:hypothetical protein n=1 Tax=Alteromonas flava TaxID=2048003 RepID=UPI000C29320C|nr:hypothetical protein [Alteromonas flava]
MNKQPLKIKNLAVAFGLYILISATLAILLTLYWQTGIPLDQYTTSELQTLAANSGLITIGTAMIGSLTALGCAYAITVKTGAYGYKHACYFAIGLTLYGALSIVLNPEHHLLQQVAKLIMPLPVCLFGAWLAIAKHKVNGGRGQPITDTATS